MQDYKQPGFWKFLENEVYLHRDVVVDNKNIRAVERWNRWFLIPFNISESGLKLTISEAQEVSRDHVYSLRLIRDAKHEQHEIGK